MARVMLCAQSPWQVPHTIQLVYLQTLEPFTSDVALLSEDI